MDLSVQEFRLRRGVDLVCAVSGVNQRYIPPGDYLEYVRTRSMRAAVPLDLNFPRLDLRPETAGPGKAHAPDKKGLAVEVYNPQYFFEDCLYIQGSRDCFEPVYGLECLYTAEPTFKQPIGFWTSTYVRRCPGGSAGCGYGTKHPARIPARSVRHDRHPHRARARVFRRVALAQKIITCSKAMGPVSDRVSTSGSAECRIAASVGRFRFYNGADFAIFSGANTSPRLEGLTE